MQSRVIWKDLKHALKFFNGINGNRSVNNMLGNADLFAQLTFHYDHILSQIHSKAQSTN
jgi:hypothetical protein